MSTSTEKQIEDAIKLEIEIAAPPQNVFKALTDTAELNAWWVEGGTSNWKLEPRVGGAWQAEGSDTKCGDWKVKGEILRYEPPSVLEFTWIEELENCAEAPPSKVRYELEASGGSTKLTLTHYGFGDDSASRERYRGGWPEVLDLLQKRFERD